jgi:hypothetical protein
MALESGARLTILSQPHIVSVLAADTLSMETALGVSFSARVLARTQGQIRVALEDGTSFTLQIEVDESLTPPGNNPRMFSRQVWVAS